MESSIFLQLAAVLAVAAGVSIVMRLLRQPLIIGYILSGIVCGPAALDLIQNREAFDSFSQIGIALLLFIVGLGLNVGVIKNTGKPVFLVFLLNTLLVGGLTYGVGNLLDLPRSESVVLAVAMLFPLIYQVFYDHNGATKQHGNSQYH
jgi:Kef-type K+ transport system membrane component KefB